MSARPSREMGFLYKRLLLASDGSKESLVALREGALIARSFRASAHLLIVDPAAPSVRVAEGYCLNRLPPRGQEHLDVGLRRLRQLGVEATGELLHGDPGPLIVSRARQLRVDLIVVGHRRQSFFDRWWSGPSGGYIVDNVPCGLLVARDTITDAEFDQYLDEAVTA